MATSCKNEKEYLVEAKKLIKEIQELDKSALSDMFFGSPPDKKYLLSTLKKILTNISEVEKIPEDKRHYEFLNRNLQTINSIKYRLTILLKNIK